MVTPVKAKITAEKAREAWSTAPEEMNDWPTRNDWKGVEDISEAGGGQTNPNCTTTSNVTSRGFYIL
jgi:hypothetical protein